MSSEIARIRQQIELESAAMKLAMDGFATVARHEFISRKYDAIGKCQEQLQTLTSEQEATQITIETLSVGYGARRRAEHARLQGYRNAYAFTPTHDATYD